MKSLETRRKLLQTTTVGAAAWLAGGAGVPNPPARAAGQVSRARSQKTGFELGVASYTFRQFHLDQALAMTKRVGLTHICLKSMHLPLEAKPPEITAAAAKVSGAGLMLDSCGVVYMSSEEQVRQAFDYAKAAGMKTIIGVPSPKLLPLVNEKVQQYDIRVSIHNHGPGDRTYPVPESAYEKIQDLDKRIGLCIDIGHTFRYGVDPIASIRKYADRLLDLHIKDVTAPVPDAQEVQVGRGAIDIPEVLRTLRQVKFAGVASFEYEAQPADPLPGLAESVGYVRGVLAALG